MKISQKKLANSHEYFNNIDDYKKPVDNLYKADFFSKLKNICFDDKRRERTKESIEVFDIKNGKNLTRLYSKSDVILLADVFENFVKVSNKKIGNISSILHLSTWVCFSLCIEIYWY